MPFSLVAVLLLVLSGMSIALMYQEDVLEEERMTPETIQALKTSSVQACEDISRTAYVAALEAARGKDALNASALQERFIRSLTSALNDTYPGHVAGSMVQIDSIDLELRVLHATMEGEDGPSSVPAYFSLGGGYSINVSTTDGHLIWVQEMDESIYVPLPLLLDRVSKLESSSGVHSDIEATARYSIAVLAQDRVLRGYGAADRDGAAGTAAIITDDDVIRAVNIALLLEEMEVFRDSMSACGVDGSLLMGKEIDAGELLLSTYEYPEYDLRFIAAQAINGALDRIVIGMMEQLGYLNPVELIDNAISTVVSGLNDFIQLCTKNDPYLEHSIDQLKQWAEDAGYEEGLYNPIGHEFVENGVFLPEYTLPVMDVNGIVHDVPIFGETIDFDIQPYDVFSNWRWEDFFDDRCADLTLMADQLKGFVRTVADQVSLYADLPVMRERSDPTNGVPWTEELLERIRTAFNNQEDWTAPAIDAVREVGKIQDAASLTTLDFIRDNWQWLTNRTPAIGAMSDRIAAKECARIASIIPLDQVSMDCVQSVISGMLYETDSEYNVILVNEYEKLSQWFKKAMEAALTARSKELNVLDEAIGMISGRVYGPTIQPIASASVLEVIAAVERYMSARYESGAFSLRDEGFVLHGPEGVTFGEMLDAEHVPLVAGDGSAGTLRVDVVRPWEQKDDEYPCNLHINDLFQAGSLPYTSQWNISYSGVAVVKVTAPAIGMEGCGEPMVFDIPMEGSFSIVTTSGWALCGIDYTPTVTLQQVISDFLAKVWGSILDGAEALGRTIAGAFDVFAKMMADVMSYALDPIGALTEALMGIIDKLGGITSSFISNVLGGLADIAGSVAAGTVIKFSLFGFSLMITVEPQVSSITGSQDRLSLEMGMDICGLSFSGSMRLLKMDEGDHTMVVSATLGKDDWSVQLCVDPRTRIYENVMRATGYFGGMVLDVVLPKVEVVNKITLSLEDIPGLGQALQNIPFIPGTKLSINAGIEVGMVTTTVNTLTINEVELNPAGRDSGKEWIELYNPTERSIDLSGWSIATSHGNKASYSLPSKIISPGENYVYTFPSQALDNGGDGSFATEECVILIDPTGEKVDRGPWVTDHHNDARTWQREHDSSSRWVFAEGTPGKANGIPFHGVNDLFGLLDILRMSFDEAFRTSGGLGDIGDLGTLIQNAIRIAVERLVTSLLGAISYVQLFVEAGVGDAAGAAEIGATAAIKISGGTLRECLLAIADNVFKLLKDPLNPSNLVRLFKPLGMIGPEDIFVEYSKHISISVPGGVMSSMFSDLLQAKASVQFNLAAADMLDGETDADWRIEFGLSAVAGINILKAPAEVRSEMEAWLIHGTLRPA